MFIFQNINECYNPDAIFGREKGESLRGSLAAVVQTFAGRDLYPGLEEKAANLLYFLVINHSFFDGNKRIAAALFLCFMEKNGILYRADMTRQIADNALLAITFMIAESAAAQKDILMKVIINLIKDRG